MRDRQSGDVLTPSRRTLIGVAASPVLAGAARATPADPTIAVCERWLAKNAEIDQWQQQWGELEAWLGQHHSWYDLSEEERSLLPGAKALQAIDAQMDSLTEQRDMLGASLASLPATNLAAIAAKLSVAVELVGPQDEPPAHQLITASIREIAALMAVLQSWF